MINDCVTQTLFNMMRSQGDSYYFRLSQRFHFALSKMIDGTNTYGGFNHLAGIRAWVGWIPCGEWKFPSNRNMSEMTYGNWRLIPLRAWKDSRKRTIKHGYQRISYFRKYPQKAFVFDEIMLAGRNYYLLVQSEYGFRLIDGSDSIISFEIFDSEYMITGWMNISAFWMKGFVKINDLYVKEEYWGQGMEIKLLQTLINWLSMQEIPKGNFKIVYFFPIIDVCTAKRKKAILDYVVQSGFEVGLLKDLPLQGMDYSKILAEYTI